VSEALNRLDPINVDPMLAVSNFLRDRRRAQASGGTPADAGTSGVTAA